MADKYFLIAIKKFYSDKNRHFVTKFVISEQYMGT